MNIPKLQSASDSQHALKETLYKTNSNDKDKILLGISYVPAFLSIKTMGKIRVLSRSIRTQFDEENSFFIKRRIFLKDIKQFDFDNNFLISSTIQEALKDQTKEGFSKVLNFLSLFRFLSLSDFPDVIVNKQLLRALLENNSIRHLKFIDVVIDKSMQYNIAKIRQKITFEMRSFKLQEE